MTSCFLASSPYLFPVLVFFAGLGFGQVVFFAGLVIANLIRERVIHKRGHFYPSRHTQPHPFEPLNAEETKAVLEWERRWKERSQ